MSFEITRRSFLKLFASAVAIGAVVPAMDINRLPYVTLGESVSYIGGRGPNGESQGFIGGTSIRNILPWDGVGYPVEVWNGIYGSGSGLETYYDFDLANFYREVPDQFWWSEENCRKYPNVHTYVREKRFGESITEAIQKLNYAGINLSDWT